MIRLKQLLLAGTILPALTLIPLAHVSAQAPDQGERHGPRAHGEGGPRGEGGQKGEGKGHGEHAGGGERHQGGPGARENAQGEHGGPKAARGASEEGPRSGEGKSRGERRQGGPAVRENAQSAPTGGPKAAEEGTKAAPGGRAVQSREERREREGGPRGGARENAERDRENAPRGAEGTRGGERQRAGDRDNDRVRDNRNRADERRDNDHARDNRDRAEDRRENDRMRDNRDRAEDRRDNGPRDNDRLRPGDRRLGDRDDRQPGPGGPGAGPAVVVSPGFGGGFLPPTQARRLDDLRRDRREVREGNSVFIREPGRTIVQENGRAFIVHDETDRYRALGLNVRRERRGADFVDVVTRPNGDQILTFTDPSGRMLRRVRRSREGREFVLIDNGVGGRVGAYADDVVALPPPPMRIPRDRYVVDYRDANPNMIYDTLIAPPLAAPPRRYTLDQVRYSPDVRNYVRSVDINTINFDSGSWDVPAAATGKLEALATAINRAVDRNPNSVFLIEGYTDATGNPNDNLSLSDRRAQSVAEILTKDFKVPPENLTTQGYGQQNPKEDTQGPSAVNRRVVVRNITQLLAAGDAPDSGH